MRCAATVGTVAHPESVPWTRARRIARTAKAQNCLNRGGRRERRGKDAGPGPAAVHLGRANAGQTEARVPGAEGILPIPSSSAQDARLKKVRLFSAKNRNTLRGIANQVWILALYVQSSWCCLR